MPECNYFNTHNAHAGNTPIDNVQKNYTVFAASCTLICKQVHLRLQENTFIASSVGSTASCILHFLFSQLYIISSYQFSCSLLLRYIVICMVAVIVHQYLAAAFIQIPFHSYGQI